MFGPEERWATNTHMTGAREAWLDRTQRGLFNSSLEGNTRRAIDFHEGDKALIRAAVALNISVRVAARPIRSQKRAESA